MSNSGSAGGPLRFLAPEGSVLGLPCESSDVLLAFAPLDLSRAMDRESVDVRSDPDELTWWSDGRTSFFCFDAGRISSRSTGTPRETRNSRRIRDRIQSGGCSGGGATSCDQSEALRGVRNIRFSLDGGGRAGGRACSGGNRALM